jgi:uncharacterized protein YbcI
MRDPNGDAPSSEAHSVPEIGDQIARSLSSIWQRHAGGRPSAANTEFRGNTVVCVMEGAVSAIGAEPAEEEEDSAEEAPASSPDSFRYRNEVIQSVRRLTGRQVHGFIPKRDAETDIATETFVLAPLHIRR